MLWGFSGESVVKNLPVKQGTGVQSLGREDPLEKVIATHSSILASEIPQTEASGGLHSMGLQRVGHNLATKQQQIELHSMKVPQLVIVWLFTRKSTQGFYSYTFGIEPKNPSARPKIFAESDILALLPAFRGKAFNLSH